MVYSFTAVVTREGKFYVSECPELGIASQGLSQEEALENTKEAILLYLEPSAVKLGAEGKVFEVEVAA